MRNENETINQLRDNIEKIEDYIPDEKVWEAINSQITHSNKKRSLTLLMAIAASGIIFLAVPISYKYKNDQTRIEINTLVKQSQVLENRISAITVNKSIPAPLKWQLLKTEKTLNNIENEQQKVKIWRERIMLLQDIITVSKHKVDFI